VSVPESVPRSSLRVLEESREREKAQTVYYRALAAHAVVGEDAEATERLNNLHADEQHHFSRLTARLLELGHVPRDLSVLAVSGGKLDGWEEEAREREAEEVRWYEAVTGLGLDEATLVVLGEILVSERHHLRDLRGKWMSA
jgi:rubrerythrin